ncbi:MAG TPA: xanthine dehydrogenase accessory protein XdhC [Geminicoccaceae bacterium]|nr:xanthine dehydrogenase accessory protein XdhC [Geminicoccaceae bacterium]
MTAGLAAILRGLLDRAEPAVVVELAEVKGSAPREAGTHMIVTAAQSHGTIGGGNLEWEAIRRARAMLGSGEADAGLKLPLGPELGQCCGGFVALRLHRADKALRTALEAQEARERETLPPVLLFGAGHVGKALAVALAPLPLRLRWIDGRADAFPEAAPAGVEVVVSEHLLEEVEAAPAGAAYLVLTHSHALDSMLCAAALQRGDFAYLGLIGSRSKRARFERGFRELGIAQAQIDRLVCPIGGGRIRDKRPAVIAALTAAELLQALAEAAAKATTGEAA